MPLLDGSSPTDLCIPGTISEKKSEAERKRGKRAW